MDGHETPEPRAKEGIVLSCVGRFGLALLCVATSGCAPLAPVSPRAAARAGACAPAPLPSPPYSDWRSRAVALDGYEAFEGLGITRQRIEQPRWPIINLRLKSHPGSNRVDLKDAALTFDVPDGLGDNWRFGPIRLPISPVSLPGAPPEAWGSVVNVPLRLPAHLLESSLLYSPPFVSVRVSFIGASGHVIAGSDGASFEAVLRVPTGTERVAAASFNAGCSGAAPEDPPLPIVDQEDGPPHLAMAAGYEPAVGATLSASGSVTPREISIGLRTAPHSAEITVSGYQVVYETLTLRGEPLRSAVFHGELSPKVLPAGSPNAPGEPVKFKVPLHEEAIRTIAAQVAAGLVIAHYQFRDGKGYLLQTESLEALDARFPIYLE